MEVLEDKKTRQIDCLKYPVEQKKKVERKVAEVARNEVANPAIFMRTLIKLRSAPGTELVQKGQRQHRFGFNFPVVIKPFDGRKMQIARSLAEMKSITAPLKGIGYQVQEFLQGYTFQKVRVVAGMLEPELPQYVRGAARRIVNYLVILGVYNFTLTVATNKVTTYIIGARLD